MRDAFVRRAPWALLVAALLFAVAAVVAVATGIEFTGALAFLALGVAYAVVGTVIAARHPHNPIGWTFTASGLLWTFEIAIDSYASWVAIERPGAFGGTAAAWFSNWSWAPSIGVPVVVALFLGADGRLASPRWRLPFVSASVGLALVTVGTMAEPELYFGSDKLAHPNPLAVPALVWLEAVGGVLAVSGLVAGAVSLALRLRHARGREHDQLEWVATTFVVAAVGATAGATLWSFVDWAAVPLVLGLVAIPVGVGVAILRHRLYDIDVVIRRTLVYGVVSAGRAGLYFGIVLALQQAFSSFAGGSALAVAGSTLAVAALFRYDARRTLEAFAARLREEVDLQSLATELRDVVEQTMQPAHVWLWLRPAGETR